MRIVIGSDHAAYEAKEELKQYLNEKGFFVSDEGCFSNESVHYPIYGAAVAKAVLAGEAERGILLCGTGIGMSLVANKFPGIRAALCHNAFTAECSREHNDANILVMGARDISIDTMKELVDIWFATDFAGDRHQTRLDMITEIENSWGTEIINVEE